MRGMLTRHPKALPWVSAVFSGSLYALLAWWLLSPPLASHVVEILTISVGTLATTALAQRRKGRP